jgi:hypothetical protein
MMVKLVWILENEIQAIFEVYIKLIRVFKVSYSRVGSSTSRH